jgi:protein-S-isoprenylcysteine O-methyltransferase Ste14
MGRALVLVYGLLAYAAFGATFVLLVDFVPNAGYLRAIDAGRTGPYALAIDVALIAQFGVLHSVLARPAIKRMLPSMIERSTYVLVASAQLSLLVWQWHAVPETVWAVTGPARFALWAVHGVGFVLVVYSTFLTNHFDLFGLRQTWRYARGADYTPVPFVEKSLYRVVRHPMMLGMILWLWATPVMSIGHLVLASGLTAYIVIGIALEERGLSRAIGAQYDDYRRRVPALVPFVRRASAAATATPSSRVAARRARREIQGARRAPARD